MMRSVTRAVYMMVAVAVATQLACGGIGQDDPRCSQIMAKVKECYPESLISAEAQCSEDLLEYHGAIVSNGCEAFKAGKGVFWIPFLMGAGALAGGAWLWDKYTSCDASYQPRCDTGMSSQLYMDNYPTGGSISVCYQGKVAHKRCFQGCQTGANGPYCVEDGPYGSNLYGGNNGTNCQQLPECYQGCGNCQQTICGWKCLDGQGGNNNNNWNNNNNNNNNGSNDWLNWNNTWNSNNNTWNNNSWNNNNNDNMNCQQLPPCYQGCPSCQMTPCGPKCVTGFNGGGGGQTINHALCMQACQQCKSSWGCPQHLQQALGICFNQGIHCSQQ